MKRLKVLLCILILLCINGGGAYASGAAPVSRVFGMFPGSNTVWVPPKPYVKHTSVWDQYCPPCRLHNKALCVQYTCQTHNRLPSPHDAAIQVGSDAWMRLANRAALVSAQQGGGPFGAVILQIDNRTGKIIRYWVSHNAVVKNHDPTAHAEIMTIREAAKDLGVVDLGHINQAKSKRTQPHAWSHCIIYSSSEPCPMCLSAIYWAGIRNLYFSATRYDAAAKGVNFSDKMIYEELKRPYKKRKEMVVRHVVAANSLDAFNYYKRNPVPRYGQVH